MPFMANIWDFNLHDTDKYLLSTYIHCPAHKLTSCRITWVVVKVLLMLSSHTSLLPAGGPPGYCYDCWNRFGESVDRLKNQVCELDCRNCGPCSANELKGICDQTLQQVETCSMWHYTMLTVAAAPHSLLVAKPITSFCSRRSCSLSAKPANFLSFYVNRYRKKILNMKLTN